MRGRDLYHVGIVVPRLEEAMSQLGAALGLRWGPVIASPPVPMVDPGSGATSAPALRLAFSVDEPHLELIEELPGSVWVCNPYSNLHHIGFWGNGLKPEAERLAGNACPVELMGLGPEHGVPTTMTYHRHPLGIRIEVVDIAQQTALAPLWTSDASADLPPTAS